MASGNGIDLGSIAAMLTDVLTGQEALRVDIDGRLDGVTREIVALKQDVSALKHDVSSLNREVSSLNREVSSFHREISSVKHDVSSLRQEVAAYHGSVMGHGIAITELDERVQRIEEHLKLPPIASH